MSNSFIDSMPVYDLGSAGIAVIEAALVKEQAEHQTFRAAVAEALAELRASLEETSDTFDSGLESWPYDDCRIRLEKVIAGLGLVVHEDQLPKILTDSQYNEWFKLSWIQDGVRVGFPVDALNLAHKEER